MSIKQIIFQENVKMTVDISTLELDKTVNENLSIIVPLLQYLANIDQLIIRGVKKSTAQKIIYFRRKNLNPRWEHIHAIKR